MTLDSISVRFGTRVSALEGAFLLDDLQTSVTPPVAPFAPGTAARDDSRGLRAFPQGQVLMDFDSVEQWRPVQGQTPNPLNDELRTVNVAGGTAAELRWRPSGSNPFNHGLRPRDERGPLRVLASKPFLDATGQGIGGKVVVAINSVYMEVEIVDDFDLFPTLEDPRTNAALIADLSSVLAAVNIAARTSPVYADEVWFAPSEASESKLRQLQETGRLNGTTTSFAALRAAQEKDPLVAAGWEGILFISFAAILLLSAIGFLIYSYLTAQKRTLEFAVLRTMGFSKRQIALVVGFEQLFVIGLGMIAGTLLGLRLGTLMIRYMGVSETGDDVLPPMILHVSWATIGSAWLVLGAAFLVTIGIVVLLYSRLALHRVLRIGES